MDLTQHHKQTMKLLCLETSETTTSLTGLVSQLEEMTPCTWKMTKSDSSELEEVMDKLD